MTRTPILVVGAGGHAKVVLDVLERMGTYEMVGLLDDNADRQGTMHAGHKVIGTLESLPQLRQEGVTGAIIALGDNARRRQVYMQAQQAGFAMVQAIHPSAQIGARVVMGGGTLVVAGVVVNADADIGVNVILNTGATVDHDCQIGAHVHISPGVHLAGRVIIGEMTHVGIGAVVLPNLRIGRNSIIGAGAVVRDDVPDNVIVVGNPARILKQNEVTLGI